MGGFHGIKNRLEESMSLKSESLVLVVSSPSGAGKTTMTRALLARVDNLSLSISVTTRKPRVGEREGVNYFFVDPQEFDHRIEGKAFLEHATVFSNRYGTPKAAVMEKLRQGGDVLFDIDWQGAQQLRQSLGVRMVSVFILPPSLTELQRRLNHRAEDTPIVVKDRMSRAMDEMTHWDEYDYVLVNAELEQSITVLESILTAERHRRGRDLGTLDFIRSLPSRSLPSRSLPLKGS